MFFGLGFAHAQDRLWQMIMLRRTAQGRLSEVFGARTLDIDKLLRRFDIYTAGGAARSRRWTRETRAALEAYAAGVNARLDQINTEALGRGAPEMWLFNAPMAPWQPADSLAIVKLMALQLSGHLRQRCCARGSRWRWTTQRRLRDILPDAPGTGVAALPEYAALVPDAPRYAANVPARPPPAVAVHGHWTFAGASNAWAAAPSRSASGGTLLANDPHLGFTAPSIWYLARLELSSGGVIGGTIPGMPVVLTGRSARLGWGLTSAYVDDQDVYIEELNPDNPEQYRTPGRLQAFRHPVLDHHGQGRRPVTLTLRWTDNGPVLPGTHYDLGTITPPGHVTALAWTALSPRDTSLAGRDAADAAVGRGQGDRRVRGLHRAAQNLTLVDRRPSR